MGFDAAIRLIRDDALDEALGELLDAWRSCRLPALADVIDEITARLARRCEPFSRRAVDAGIATWKGRGKTASEDGRILGLLFERHNQHKNKMLEDVVTWSDDPRVAMALTEFAIGASRSTHWWIPKAPSLWKRVFQRITEIGDARVVARLETIVAAGSKEAFDRRIAKLAALAAQTIEKTAQSVPSPQQRAELERLAAALERTRSTWRRDDELAAAVYANPDDDAPRLAYATFLSEHGDPRGDFIRLQIAATRRSLTHDETTTVTRLLDQHLRTWLGPIQRGVDSWLSSSVPRYERGFVVACRISSSAKDYSHEAAWHTVRELAGRIDHPVMYALRRLSEVGVEDVAQLCAGGTLALESLEVSVGRVPEELERLATILRETSALPRLRELGIERFNWNEQPSPKDALALLVTPFAGRFESFRCPTGCASIPAWISELDASAPQGLKTLDLSDDPVNPAWRLTLTRGPDGRFSSLAAHCPRGSSEGNALTQWLLPALESLSTDALTELTVSWERWRPAAQDIARLHDIARRLPRTMCTLQR